MTQGLYANCHLTWSKHFILSSFSWGLCWHLQRIFRKCCHWKFVMYININICTYIYIYIYIYSAYPIAWVSVSVLQQKQHWQKTLVSSGHYILSWFPVSVFRASQCVWFEVEVVRVIRFIACADNLIYTLCIKIHIPSMCAIEALIGIIICPMKHTPSTVLLCCKNVALLLRWVKGVE